PAYLSLMNSAIVIRRVKDKFTKQSIRRVISVEEITGESKPNSVIKWEPKSDYFSSNFEESKNLKKISEQTGIDFETILEEHQRRIQILKWLNANNIREHKQVSEMIRKYYNDPDAVLKKINYSV
ncbi:MAG: secretion system protein E, partial [Nitrosopumilaceae archaeon]|nr:secretion system protein E [Nitrosopumilaceae archaeon]